MIQRIQSVWLLLAALVMAAIFYFPLYKFSGTSKLPLSIGEDFLAIVLATASIVLSMVTIFMFKNRKNQKGLVWINILLSIALQVWLVMSVNKQTNSAELSNVSGYYWVGLFVPLVCLIFLFLAKGGINKDQKLVKSLDRLR